MRGYYGVVPSKSTTGCVQTMERKEILEKLKSTEAEIRSSIDAAQHKRNEILTHAQKQAQKLEDDGERRMKAERDELLAAAKKEIGEKRQCVVKKAITDADTLKKKAQIKKAKEFFVEEFMEFFHV
jgi:vacuolar-type H+-ATPase subunit H